MKRVHLIVSGLVHGVGFRYNTRRKARLSSLTGFVRNLADGSVEIEAQGTTEALERFIHWAHHGPANAKVESLRQEEIGVIENESEFVIR
ncbi:MAG: acylphosphatase [Bacteroidota bacterium]|nr:acylphosphatase [Bacteroidota bacterium]MDP4229914.1 acylphosphatase [Bacteroidota bacterium]MDP4235584.1 acylphosphatase [Bacteroidota bacterium]